MGNLQEKYGKGKIYLVIAFLLIVINITISFFAYKASTTFAIDNEKFKYLSQDDKIVLFEDSDGNELKVIIQGRRSNLFAISNIYEVVYKDKVIRFDGSNIMDGPIITLSDGSKYVIPRITFANDNKENSNVPFDVKLINNIEDVYSIVEDYSVKGVAILSIPIIFMGLGLIVYPKEWWRFQHMFSVSGGEPTDLALFSNIAGGIFLIGFVILMPFFIIRG